MVSLELEITANRFTHLIIVVTFDSTYPLPILVSSSLYKYYTCCVMSYEIEVYIKITVSNAYTTSEKKLRKE